MSSEIENFVAVGQDKRRKQASLRGIFRQTFLRAKQGNLPAFQQILEMLVLKIVYGLGPGHYHSARYWRRELTWSFKTGFWPYRKFRRVVSRINPPEYQKLSQNKVCEKSVLLLFDIPTPCFVGSLHYQSGLANDGFALTNAEELHRLLEKNPALEKICFKLMEGYGGVGFRAVKVLRRGEMSFRILDSGKNLSVSQFLSDELRFHEGESYIVEEYIEQHSDLSRMNPSSVNTLRVWVSRVNGETSVIDAFLRVGGSGSLVDNTSRGGQIFKVLLDSGRVGDGMAKTIYNESFQCHRDSGYRITGCEIPYWREVLELSRKALRVFPHTGFAGVDVAITDGGPVIIELNVEPDPTSAIIFDRPHSELLSAFKGLLT